MDNDLMMKWEWIQGLGILGFEHRPEAKGARYRAQWNPRYRRSSACTIIAHGTTDDEVVINLYAMAKKELWDWACYHHSQPKKLLNHGR